MIYYIREVKFLTCPSYPPTSAFATTWVITEPRPSNPYCVAQSLLNLKWLQMATASAGPWSGAAIARNLATSRPAWQRVHVLVPNTGFVLIESICSIAWARRRELDAVGGSGWGSVVSFWSKIRTLFATIRITKTTLGMVFGFVSDNGYTLCFQMRWLVVYHLRVEFDAQRPGPRL